MVRGQYLSYDETVDHLTLYKSDDVIASNIDVGLAILSLNDRKELIGIEFMGAHKNFKIPLNVLKNLQKCRVDIQYNPSKKIIIINVILQHLEHESPLTWSHSEVDLGSTAFSETFACSAA